MYRIAFVSGADAASESIELTASKQKIRTLRALWVAGAPPAKRRISV
jgi:hypothetical protein